MFTLEDKVAIVTGGSSGIGLSSAIALADLGAKVLITGRKAAALEQVAGAHPGIVPLVADVADRPDATRTIDKAIDQWGRIDILINNAGAGGLFDLKDATAQKISGILAVNVVGPSLLSAAALRYLQTTTGVIVNISSTFGHRPGAGLSHYAASKAALEHLTRCWALELSPLGIRVNAVAAGPTESGALTGMMGLSPEEASIIEEAERELIPLKRRGKPEDVARWVVHFCDPGAEWVTGQIIAIDGGLGLT